jgi:hypothetical protein
MSAHKILTAENHPKERYNIQSTAKVWNLESWRLLFHNHWELEPWDHHFIFDLMWKINIQDFFMSLIVEKMM